MVESDERSKVIGLRAEDRSANSVRIKLSCAGLNNLALDETLIPRDSILSATAAERRHCSSLWHVIDRRARCGWQDAFHVAERVLRPAAWDEKNISVSEQLIFTLV